MHTWQLTRTWHRELILVVVLLDRIDVWLCQTKSLVPGPKQQGKLYAWTTASLNLIQCKLDKKITSVLVFVRMGEVTTEELATLQREFDWLLSQEVLRLVEQTNHCCCWLSMMKDPSLMVASNTAFSHITTRFLLCWHSWGKRSPSVRPSSLCRYLQSKFVLHHSAHWLFWPLFNPLLSHFHR